MFLNATRCPFPRRGSNLLQSACCETTDRLFTATLAESQWQEQVAALLRLANTAADLMTTHAANVLVSLENGWDQTAQVRMNRCFGGHCFSK